MTPHDPRASMDVRITRCRYCEEDIRTPEGERIKRYCSDECRRAAAALRVKLHRHDLAAHGLCPHCKQPRQ